MHLIIQKTADGSRLRVDNVDPGTSVYEIKCTIEPLTHIPPERQVLQIGPMVLANDRALASYGLRDGALLLVGTEPVAVLAPSAAIGGPAHPLGVPDEMDLEIQRRLEEEIRKENVEESLLYAYENNRERSVKNPTTLSSV